MPYHATLDRNGTEDEITIYTPDGRPMLCFRFWDEPDIESTAQIKTDAKLIVDALNAYLMPTSWWSKIFQAVQVGSFLVGLALLGYVIL